MDLKSSSASFQTCPMCGAENGERATVCLRCGEALKPGYAADHGLTRKQVRDFRAQTLSLGAIWLILGVVYLIAAAVFAPIALERDLISIDPAARWLISGVAAL